MKKEKKIPSGLKFVMWLLLVEMIAVFVISWHHHTLMACFSYFISVLAMLYILYLLINKPMELSESDTTICYYSEFKMQQHTIYRSLETVPQEIRDGGYTFFCRGSGKDAQYVYMYSPNVSFPSIVYIFSSYYCRMKSDGGEWKRIFIYSKSDGVDKTNQEVGKAVLFGVLFAIFAGIAVLFYTNIKYQSEFREFYDNHVTYHAEIPTETTLESNILYNLNSMDSSADITKHFEDCDFTLVVCEDNQGGYLFVKCICLDSSKYSVDIVNLNPYVRIDSENLETKMKHLDDDYQAIVTLIEDTFKMRFQHFAFLKYDEFAQVLTEDTMPFVPQNHLMNAIQELNSSPEQLNHQQKALAEFYLSSGLEMEAVNYNYVSYVAEIMKAKEAYWKHLKMNGKYPKTMEASVYQMENDFIFSILQNIAGKHFTNSSNSQCIETNLSWDSVENLLMLSTYKNKSLYHSYYTEENTVSIPYTSDCMWYEGKDERNLYVSENYIDSLTIKWLYYTVGR
ncbi:MAG: hypothetical protein V3G42_08810 [Oscillospiraceae bacterium]